VNGPKAESIAAEITPGEGDRDAQRIGEAAGARAVQAALDEHLSLTRGSVEPAHRPLPRRSFINDMPDRGLFVLITVVVAAGIIAAKTHGIPALPIAIAAVASMLLYGLLAYRFRAVRLRLDRLGDNFYYMGFIFTLASMAAALLQLNAGVEVEALLGSFGISLLTTMAGIGGRVTLVQMRSEVDDVEERIRRDLLEAGDQLRGQLAAAVRDLEAFRLGTQQVIEERMRQTLDGYTNASLAQVSRLGDTAREIMDRVEAAFGANHKHAQTLNEIAQRTVDAADILLQRIAAINPPPDVLEKKLGQLAEKLTASADSFVTASAADEKRQRALGEIGDRLQTMLQSLSSQVGVLGEQFDTLAKAGAEVKTISTSFDTLRGRLDTLSASMAEQEIRVKDGTALAAKARAQIESDLGASRSAVLEVQRAMAETARVVTSQLRDSPGGSSQ
jgi:hypothetical protein